MARWCTADSSSAKVWTTGTVSEHQVFVGQGGTMLGIGQIGPTRGKDAQFGVPEPWPCFCARGSGQAATFVPRHLLPHSDIVQDVLWLFVCGFSPIMFRASSMQTCISPNSDFQSLFFCLVGSNTRMHGTAMPAHSWGRASGTCGQCRS